MPDGGIAVLRLYEASAYELAVHIAGNHPVYCRGIDGQLIIPFPEAS
jgi:hypothetical protein